VPVEHYSHYLNLKEAAGHPQALEIYDANWNLESRCPVEQGAPDIAGERVLRCVAFD
jgi:hypothetical protein